jgi:hypothetical protein
VVRDQHDRPGRRHVVDLPRLDAPPPRVQEVEDRSRAPGELTIQAEAVEIPPTGEERPQRGDRGEPLAERGQQAHRRARGVAGVLARRLLSLQLTQPRRGVGSGRLDPRLDDREVGPDALERRLRGHLGRRRSHRRGDGWLRAGLRRPLRRRGPGGRAPLEGVIAEHGPGPLRRSRAAPAARLPRPRPPARHPGPIPIEAQRVKR